MVRCGICPARLFAVQPLEFPCSGCGTACASAIVIAFELEEVSSAFPSSFFSMAFSGEDWGALLSAPRAIGCIMCCGKWKTGIICGMHCGAICTTPASCTESATDEPEDCRECENLVQPLHVL